MQIRWMAGILVATALLSAATIRVEASIPPSQALDFMVKRDSAAIGRHVLQFREEGDELQVDIDIDIEVSFLFMTVYSYSHQNREVWRDGRLITLETRTNDNGETFSVRGQATENGFAVEGADGRFIAPSDIIPTSYWAPSTRSQTQLLDTQHGRLIDVEIEPVRVEEVMTNHGSTTAMRYAVKGDLTLSLWYSPSGEWVKIAFDTRGATVEYQLQSLPPELLRAAR